MLLIIVFDIEGVGEMFCVFMLDLENLLCNDQGKVDFDKDFFGKEFFLIVFGQLNGEIYVCVLFKIYIFGLIFCVENFNISCYLVEFWMLELEVVFVNLNDIVGLVEVMLKYVFKVVFEECVDDMKFFVECVDKDVVLCLECFIEVDFVQVDYIDVVIIFENCGRKFENLVYWGVDFFFEYECYLVEEYFKVLVVVKNYLKDIKVFYMCFNEDGKIVVVMDVLVLGIGEIIGGFQCEECLDVLDECMLEMGLNKEDYWWYCDLCCYGIVLYVGFGLGFECLLVYVCGLFNICDVIFYFCVVGLVEF